MKFIQIIVTLGLIGQTLLQGQSTWTNIDTLESYEDKTLVEYRSYTDSNLIVHAKAYFYPTVLEMPKFRILRNLFTTEIQVDSIVFHGDRKTYLNNRNFKIQYFENGELISTSYFDSTSQEISETEFQKVNYIRGPCGLNKGHYFYHGKKKKN